MNHLNFNLLNVKAIGGVSAASLVLKTNLVAYYKMDEASGDIVDSHGSKTVTGTPGSGTGIISTCRTFNGSQYCSRADDVDFEPGSGKLFFVTLWAKAGSLSQSSYPGIIAKATDSGNNKEWGVLFNDASNKPYLFVTSDGSTEVSVTGASAFADTSTWLFIAAGNDGTNIKISVNGGAFAETPFSSNVFAGSATLNIGARNSGAAKFNGSIDELAFWKGRCLTLSEVQAIYNSGAGLSYDLWI